MNYSEYLENAVNYVAYQELFAKKSENPDAYEKGQYLALNLQRSNRLDKNFQLNEEQRQQAVQVPAQTWLVISEHWCGDASQIIPVIAKIAEASQGKITLRLVYRDEVPELMQAHLTNGGMSVPKIVKLDANAQLLADWGPRPEEAQQLVKALKANPETADNYTESLHRWYAVNKQQSTVEALLTFAQDHQVRSSS